MKTLFSAGLALLILSSAPARAQDTATDMADMPGMDMSHGAIGMDMSKMTSGLGAYPMTRDASGTSWQPDASRHDGLQWSPGGWMVMAHALVNGVYDSQSGPRGADKAFVAGMAMIEGTHSAGPDNTIMLKGMFSADPFMGPTGYPLLLGFGETADGKDTLIDRQHPHDLVMELAAAFSHKIGAQDSVFVYAGLPGEPALGPPAFMHRMSGMDNPEAPITHHWLDSTHITYGVITGGWVHGAVKLEVSAFKGREPDQRRFDIESPRLDSGSVRVSFNPNENWSLQASWGRLISPEQLEPTVNEDRFTASAIYTRPVGVGGWWSTTAAFGSKQESYGQTLNGWLLETALHPSEPWTLFARAESEQNNELLASGAPAKAAPSPSKAYTVGKLSLGVIHDWSVAPHVKIGLGGLYDFALVPASLRSAYGADPHGATAFIRLKLD